MAIQIQFEKKYGFLLQMAQRAKAASSTLREILLSALDGHFTPSFERGRLMVSTSGSGQSGSFEIGMTGKEWTQDNVFGLISEFIRLLDFTVAAGTPDAADNDTIDTLVATMADNILSGNVPQTGARTQMGDFSGLNYPASSLK